ncbi:MAG: ribosome small subunit-dependent GTPase A [Planctomycetes bacterium]|nr:ribosome small subunit-dependent GTPase A [Planctomycetota bacterium]MBI3845386.1 ribosome small subunit-dependent GTPase A [Planctomycetota bacterium]
MHSLIDLGWDSTWQRTFDSIAQAAWVPARVLGEGRDVWRVGLEGAELLARVPGRMRHDAATMPAVGDWVAVEARLSEGTATIHAVLARRTRLSRRAAGRATAEQVIAANLDSIFVVSALDRELNARRIERWLALVWESGARPVVVLNKADRLGEGLADPRSLEAVALGAQVHAVSARTGEGIESLTPYLERGRTVALVGSSGVGKSSLINRLAGDLRLATNEVRAGDDRGRHTTTARSIVALPSGALVVDTPGLREVGLWAGEEALGQTFEDVATLAASCRFRDCRHVAEPGCAVRRAVDEGALAAERLESFHKLQREIAHVARQTDALARIAVQKKTKQIHRDMRKRYRERGK